VRNTGTTNGRGGGSNGNGGGVVTLDGTDLVDPYLERSFVGACLLMPELILDSEVTESDIYSENYRRIFSALLHMRADGEEINTLSLRSYFVERNQLAGIGGDDALLELTDTIPDRNGPWKKLRVLAARRRMRTAAQLVASKLGTDECSRYIAQFQAAALELDQIESKTHTIPTLAELIPGIEQRGPRLQTELAALDASLRGGIPLGRFVVLVGAPGASKTNFATWLADKWERVGCASAIISADESRESVITRLGQLSGFDRDNLEGEDPGRRNAFARSVAHRTLMVIDPSADECSLEEAEKQLIDFARGKPRVLVVDSLQTVRCEYADQFETTRERIEAVISVIKGICARGTLVIGISEMSRAGYRTGKRDQDTGALSSAAESRAIEYAAHLLLGLRPVKGDNGGIDVETGKNRIGPDKPELRMRIDFATLQFREIQRPADEQAEVDNKRTAELRARVLAELVKNPATHKTRGSLQRAVGARKTSLCEVMRELVEEGSIDKVGGFFRVVATNSAGGVA
jgi:replicative DNA helicase